MRRATAFVALWALAAWVLPLGAFIKPSMEKIACGGHRAFHMCCSMGKIAPSHGPAFEHAAGFAPSRDRGDDSSGQDFFVPPASAGVSLRAAGIREDEYFPTASFRPDPLFRPPIALFSA
ncbi:MAG TPA: hypothetical protein VL404_02475 [Candidatus Eisenbacteria bacterium]|jgi:hypothetical protein|nr:hypothetical protein [Candidatus Eisenbacteria bacterium]